MAQIHEWTEGAPMEPLPIGPLMSSHLVRWCAAQQNWDKIHYDQEYCRRYAGLENPVIQGGMKQHLIVEYIVHALSGVAWIWGLRIKYKSPDFVGETLEMRGSVQAVRQGAKRRILCLEIQLFNLSQDKVTAEAFAVVCEGEDYEGLNADCEPLMRELFSLDATPDHEYAPLPEKLGALVGVEHERMQSAFSVDLSRLRLFADALGKLSPMHYLERYAERTRYGSVVAPPLFPLHAIEALPSEVQLDTSEEAMGREGVNEIGRNLARRFEFSNAKMVNGGSEFEIYRLLQVGDRVQATSTLLSAKLKESRSAGAMLITNAFNQYFNNADQLLLREKQVTIYRDFDVKTLR